MTHDEVDSAAAVASTSRRKRSLIQVRANDPPYEAIERRSCNCKNSRCLKLYCECFPAADHQILTNRGFLLLDQVLSLVHSRSADDGTVVVADWRGLSVASFDPTSSSLVYRTPRRLVVNGASPLGVPVIEFNVPHSGVSVVTTQHHELYVAAASSPTFAKVPCVDVLARRDSVRLLAVASGGVSIDGGADAWRQMPCVAHLALTARSQFVAFLELYGIWLASGDIDAQAVRFRCVAASLFRERCKRSGLCADEFDARAGAVYKRSWIELFAELRSRSGELLDGALSLLDCGAARAILAGVEAGGSILKAANDGVVLRDRLMQLVMHCGFTASFVPVACGWRLELDAAHAEPRLDVRASNAARTYRCSERTWCFDMCDGFVVVRRVAAPRKDGAAVSASRPTIQGNCFAARVYCTDNCACVSCQNAHEHERIVAKAIDDTQERNPTAFSVEEKVAKGCNCKKSSCLKKYCECFQAGIACSRNCRCVDCKNHEGDAVRQASSRRLSNVSANVELTTDAPHTVAATDDDAVYLSASQVAAHTVARDWASEAALVDIAASLIKRARHAALDDGGDDVATTAAAALVAQSPLDSVATAIRESGELPVRGGSAVATAAVEATNESYARQERAVLVGVREILDKAVNDLSRL